CGGGRLVARRRRLVQSFRANEAASALLSGSAPHTAEYAPLESPPQRPPGHRAVGRVGLVGRHAIDLEDARRADCRPDATFAVAQSVLGLGHRRLLHHGGTDGRAVRAVVPVLRLLSVVSIPWPHLALALALGLGIERHGIPRRPEGPSQTVGNEQPNDR